MLLFHAGMEDEQLVISGFGHVHFHHVCPFRQCEIVGNGVVAGDVAAPHAAVGDQQELSLGALTKIKIHSVSFRFGGVAFIIAGDLEKSKNLVQIGQFTLTIRVIRDII